MKEKEKIRDKFWDERRPAFDLDMVEVRIPDKDLDAFLWEHAKRFLSLAERTPADIMRNRKRHDKMKYKVFRAAALCLTDRQFQIFILRHKFLFKEIEIARQVGVNQPYVSNTLQVCHSKIRRLMHLEKERKRGPRVKKQKKGSKKRVKFKRKNTSRNSIKQKP